MDKEAIVLYTAYVVDDERWSLLGLCTILPWQKYGFSLVGSSSDPAQALSDIIRDPPDAVFTDMRMPGVSGSELMAHAREQGITAEFIVISGYSEFAYTREAIVHGAFDYCLKPLLASDADELLKRLRDRLDCRHPVANEKDSFGQLLAYIDKHSDQPLKLQDLAVQFYLSPNYVSSLFRNRLKTSFSVYLANLRLEQAAYLLSSTNLPVAEVAVRSGYTEPRYFARAFHKAKQKTPLQYRRLHHE